MKGCAGAYWANLLISSITQINGDASGALFDTQNFQFLTTDAVVSQVLLWMEKQVEFGADGGTNSSLGGTFIGFARGSLIVCLLNFRI
jgi:hypothetical protein